MIADIIKSVVPVVMVFSVPLAGIFVWYKLRSKKMLLEAKKMELLALGASKKSEVEQENLQLKQRLESLETIVLNIDQKLERKTLHD